MATAREVPPISAVILGVFRRIVRGYFRRHFRAVMVQQQENLALAQGPLIVYANHSSWWDPMVCILLGELLLPGRKHYAPMDAAALERYPVLKKVGIFPVEMQMARGTAHFLRTSEAILASGGVVWITPQGRFVDPREPLTFKPGLGALAIRVPGLRLQPLAIEYTFWNERLPETLLRFGETVELTAGTNADAATQILQQRLADAMRELRIVAIARDPSTFTVLQQGGRGPGGIYAFVRRLGAMFTRTPVALDHTPRGDDSKGDTSR